MHNRALILDDVTTSHTPALDLSDITVESFEVSFNTMSSAQMAFLVANPSGCPSSDGCPGCD